MSMAAWSHGELPPSSSPLNYRSVLMCADQARPSKGAKPLKEARSKAELHAIRQRNIQITLSVLILVIGLANLLIQAF
jgi:hypothetical protein